MLQSSVSWDEKVLTERLLVRLDRGLDQGLFRLLRLPSPVPRTSKTFCACIWPRNMSCAHLTASSDPTICDPLQKALIQQQYGCRLEDTPEPLLRHLVALSRTRGNAAFHDGQYAGAQTQSFQYHPVDLSIASCLEKHANVFCVFCRSCEMLQPSHCWC